VVPDLSVPDLTGDDFANGSQFAPLNFINCICSMGKKSFGPVLILIPGTSASLVKSLRLADCFITFSAEIVAALF
jgi:hypothetical protein